MHALIDINDDVLQSGIGVPSYRRTHALIDINDDVFLFDSDWEGIGDVGTFLAFRIGCLDFLTALDMDFVFSNASLCRTPPRLSCFYVEFPTVPWASENLAVTGVVIVAGCGGF